MKVYYCTFIILILFKQYYCQDCRMPSESCNDDKNCCGGCCENSICIDTYHDCRMHEDPCFNHYCPPDMMCTVFYPTDCEGCEPQSECVDSPPPPTSIKTTTPSYNQGNLNKNNSFCFILFILFCINLF